jgi:hypothetical protein
MKPLLLLTLLLFPWLVSAQSFTIRGVVRAQADRVGLPGVTLVEKGTTNGTSTNAQGRFTLVTTRSAPRLVVSSIGYLTQEVGIPRGADSVVVILQEDTHALAEVVVVGYAATSRRSVTGAVSTLSGTTAGVRIRGASSVPTVPRAERRTTATPNRTRTDAGILTAGEINDFSKWQLWPDLAQQNLREWRHRWRISPLERYTAQVISEDGFPVVGATVRLKDSRDSVLWQAQSDNTGKCELWNNLFITAVEQQVASLQAVVAGKTYTVRRPTRFHDGLNLIRVQGPCRAPSVIDIAFVVDATGSMGDEIQYLQAELGAVIAQAQDSLAATTINLGSVFYRDAGDEYVTRTTNFSAHLQPTLDFIRQQQAGGGGDFPEAVDQALAVAVNELSWTPHAKARLLFLILDAPPHENPQVLASLQQSIRKAAAKGIRLIPLAASGIDKSTEYLMRSLALATNGTYVFLTDDSGVGEAHLKPTTDQFEVEQLTRLLVKLVTKYAYTADCQAPTPSLAGQPKPVVDTAAVAPTTARPARASAWKCYPNPTSDILHVEWEGEIKELLVTDVTGKVVLRTLPAHQQAAVQLSNFPTGLYFVRFFTGKKWEQARFLVRR